MCFFFDLLFIVNNWDVIKLIFVELNLIWYLLYILLIFFNIEDGIIEFLMIIFGILNGIFFLIIIFSKDGIKNVWVGFFLVIIL